jgi:hypothetical protein
MSLRGTELARGIAGLALLAALAACGPVSPQLAAQQCQERARAAVKPQARVVVGVSNKGPFAAASFGVTSDYLQGADPYWVYDQCVRQKTGQGPVVPLDLG